MSADRDEPYLPGPHLADTGRIEATSGAIALAALVILLAAVGISQAVIYLIRSFT